MNSVIPNVAELNLTPEIRADFKDCASAIIKLNTDDSVIAWCAYTTGVLAMVGTPGINVVQHNQLYGQGFKDAGLDADAVPKFSDDRWRDLSRLMMSAAPSSYIEPLDLSSLASPQNTNWNIDGIFAVRAAAFARAVPSLISSSSAG